MTKQKAEQSLKKHPTRFEDQSDRLTLTCGMFRLTDLDIQIPHVQRVLFDELDRLTESLDLLGGVIWNVDVEFLFQLHDEFDDVERIRADILDEAGLVLDLALFDGEMFANDLDHSRPNLLVAHASILVK